MKMSTRRPKITLEGSVNLSHTATEQIESPNFDDDYYAMFHAFLTSTVEGGKGVGRFTAGKRPPPPVRIQ
jgi:hypothetical protein